MSTGAVYVDKMDPYWPKPVLMKWLGEVYHECGHHQPECSDITALMEDKGICYGGQFGRFMNGVEDYRQEKFMHRKGYAGVSESLSWTQGFYCQRGAMQLKGASVDDQLFVDFLGWLYHSRANWQPDVTLSSVEFDKCCDYSKWEHLSERLDTLVTAEDVYNLVRELLESAGEDADELEKESQELSSSAGGEGEGGDSNGEAMATSEGEGEDGEGPVTISYKDLMGHNHESDEPPAKDSPLVIVYDHEPGDFVPTNKEGKIFQGSEIPDIDHYDLESIGKFVASGRSLAGAARRLFQSRMQSQTIHNRKAGRLDKRDLYRVPTGAVDVFKRKSDAVDPRGTALFLLVDSSGSMSGKPYCLASASAVLLNEAVQPLNIPTMVAGFTENNRGLLHIVHKPFEGKTDSTKMMDSFARGATKLCQNNDGESILWAYRNLMARKEERKILIVLSDGQPATYQPGDAFTFTKDVIHTISKQVECYGVGICDRTVQELYPEWKVLRRPEELEQCLLDIVKVKIFS